MGVPFSSFKNQDEKTHEHLSEDYLKVSDCNRYCHARRLGELQIGCVYECEQDFGILFNKYDVYLCGTSS